MCLTASTGFVCSEKLPEDADNPINEAQETAFVADAGAVFSHIFSASIALAVLIGVSVICRRNDFLFNEDFTADRTVLTLGKTGFGAGRSNRLVDNDCMTFC